MRLAVIGRDRHVDQLVRSAQHAATIDVVAFFPDAVGDHLPGVIARQDWESLEAEGDVDAIILASAGSDFLERRASQLRMLIQTDLPILAVHPPCEAIVAFEIEMQADPERARLITYQPWRDQPGWERVRQVVETGEPLGQVTQIIMERRVERPMTVTTALAQDATIARRLIGPIRQVSSVAAVGDGPDGPIQLLGGQREETTIGSPNGGAAPPSIRWSPQYVPPFCDLRVQLVGQSGAATLQWNDGEPPSWRVGEQSEPFEVVDAPAEALQRLRQLLNTEAPGLNDWVEAARGTEIAEAAQRSSRRGRAVELYEESHSERDTFKGVMAASGCLLLLMILLGFIIAAVIEGVRFPYARKAYQRQVEAAERAGRPLPEQTTPTWIRLIPAYPVVVFLLLQTLWFVARRSPKGVTQPPEDPPNARGRSGPAP